MKKTTRRLSLCRSTIQHLSTASLARVRGGIITDTVVMTEGQPCDTGGGNSTLCDQASPRCHTFYHSCGASYCADACTQQCA